MDYASLNPKHQCLSDLKFDIFEKNCSRKMRVLKFPYKTYKTNVLFSNLLIGLCIELNLNYIDKFIKNEVTSNIANHQWVSNKYILLVRVRTQYMLFDVLSQRQKYKNKRESETFAKSLYTYTSYIVSFVLRKTPLTQCEPLSLESKKRQAEERKIETEIHSKSVTEVMATFLLLSNKPINSSITITCPSFVFSSLTDFTSNHWGRS